jgi:DNA-binding transcriptional LysR family regulator
MDRPDPRALRQFLVLLETRSFRLAAEQLGLSQSALTKSLQRLEQELQLRLFDRTTRSVVPTAAALALAHQAETALHGLSGFREAAAALRQAVPERLRVGAIALAAESVVAPALAQLHRSHPQIAVELVVGSADVYSDLAQGQCDVVVGDRINFESSPFAQSMRMQPLCDEPLVAVYRRAHPLAQGPTLTGLLEYPWAIPSRYFEGNLSLQALATRVGQLHFPQYRMTSLAACLELVASTDVVALAPLTIARSATLPGLDAFDLALDLKVSLVLLTLARVSPSASVQAFQEAIGGVVA